MSTQPHHAGAPEVEPVGPATMLGPGQGRLIAGGALHATLKVAGGPAALTSTFEIEVPAGYDVGAHVHTRGEEIFYVVRGTVDLLAFEPVDRSVGDWHNWVSEDGRGYLRGGPGSMMHIPAGVPHAFANTSDQSATLFFQSSPQGHEGYFEELAALLRESGGRPDSEAVAQVRSRHDIFQLTSLVQGPGR